MNLDQFKQWALSQGQVAKIQGDYAGECVSLINQYLYRVYGITAGAWGHAKDWGTSAPVLQYFDRVGSPQAGDIVYWGPNLGGGYGHIGILLGSGMMLDQNGDGRGRVAVRPVFANPAGYLRRKGTTNQGVIMNTNDGKELYLTGLHRPAESEAAASQWNGRTPASALNVLRTTPEWQATDAKVKGYDSLAKQVADLSARPTKEQLQAVVDQFSASQAKVAELEAKIKENPDTQLLDEGGSWLSKIIKRLLGGK